MQREWIWAQEWWEEDGWERRKMAQEWWEEDGWERRKMSEPSPLSG